MYLLQILEFCQHTHSCYDFGVGFMSEGKLLCFPVFSETVSSVFPMQWEEQVLLGLQLLRLLLLPSVQSAVVKGLRTDSRDSTRKEQLR